jgi:hypothetical protein
MQFASLLHRPHAQEMLQILIESFVQFATFANDMHHLNTSSLRQLLKTIQG